MTDQRDPGGITPLEKYLNTRQVAELFGVHVITVKRWLNAGKLRGTSNGHRWYISPAAIREFAAKNENVPRGCFTETPAEKPKRGGPGPVRRARYEADRGVAS